MESVGLIIINHIILLTGSAHHCFSALPDTNPIFFYNIRDEIFTAGCITIAGQREETGFMNRLIRSVTAVLLISALLSGAWAEPAGDPERVTPAESFYGYVNQDVFTAFDSGIEGARVEPVYGELICPDPVTTYQYSGDRQIQAALDAANQEITGRLFSGMSAALPGKSRAKNPGSLRFPQERCSGPGSGRRALYDLPETVPGGGGSRGVYPGR